MASIIENSDRLHSYQGEVLQRGQNHSGIIHSIARNLRNKAVYFFFLPLPQSTKCSDFCSQESSVWPPVVCSEWPFVSLVWVFLFLLSSSSSRPLTPGTLCIRRALCTQGFTELPSSLLCKTSPFCQPVSASAVPHVSLWYKHLLRFH